MPKTVGVFGIDDEAGIGLNHHGRPGAGGAQAAEKRQESQNGKSCDTLQRRSPIWNPFPVNKSGMSLDALMARACLDLEEKLDAARALAERRKKALEPFLDSIIKSDLAFARYNNCKCGMVAAPIEIDEAKAAYDATE